MSQKNRILALILSLSLLGVSGCAYRQTVQQGNIITDSDIQSIHRGMSTTQVSDRMGQPVLTNVFPDGRVDYVYTLQHNRKRMQERLLLVHFINGRVNLVETYSSPNLQSPH